MKATAPPEKEYSNEAVAAILAHRLGLREDDATEIAMTRGGYRFCRC